MILPKISSAILSMANYGSAYALKNHPLCISFEQWVVMAGATNGAACVFGVDDEDAKRHRQTARRNFGRYAQEHGLPLDEFEPLFERGVIEGDTLTRRRANIMLPRHEDLIKGFHFDKEVDYARMRLALDAPGRM